LFGGDFEWDLGLLMGIYMDLQGFYTDFIGIMNGDYEWGL